MSLIRTFSEKYARETTIGSRYLKMITQTVPQSLPTFKL
jgi:hypothetical protein